MWGFITCLNDILIPYLKGSFTLSNFQANLVQFAFFGAYFVGSVVYFLLSFFSGDPIAKAGYKKSLITGLLVSGAGCVLFYPAAQLHSFGFFLTALFCLGIGFTILQIAANPYVSLLGEPETASSRLNMAQSFNSFGTTIAPVIGGYFIFEYFFVAGADNSEAVKTPYLILAGAFVLLAFLIGSSKLPKVTSEEQIEKKAGALKHPHLIFGMIAVFCYVGAEVAIGSNIVSFLGLEKMGGMEEAKASKFLAFYWGGAMIGRFTGSISLSKMTKEKKYLLMAVASLGSALLIYLITGIAFREVAYFLIFMVVNFVGFILGKSKPARTLAVFALVAVILLLIGVHTEGSLAMWCILAIGLFNSIMWSNIFTLAIDGLGKYTSQGSGLLIMMILGGALISPLQGLIADQTDVQTAFLAPVVCYVYLFYYGAKGYQVRKANISG